MAKDRQWELFCQTGRVEDYLRYRGIVLPPAKGESTGDGADKRGTDHPGKRQNR